VKKNEQGTIADTGRSIELDWFVAGSSVTALIPNFSNQYSFTPPNPPKMRNLTPDRCRLALR